VCGDTVCISILDSRVMKGCGSRVSIKLPSLIVFDLDNCCWNPELFMLSRLSAPFTYNATDNSCQTKQGVKIELCSDVAAVWGSILNTSGTDCSGNECTRLGELVLAQELGIDVEMSRKKNFASRDEVMTKIDSLTAYDSKQKKFLADLLWEEVGFNECGTTRIAIASRCDEPEWARELLHKFRIFEPQELKLTTSMASAILSEDYVQIHRKDKTEHHRNLREASGIPFSDMLFFDDQTRNIISVRSLGVLSIQTHAHEGISWRIFVEGLRQFNEQSLEHITGEKEEFKT